MTVRERCYRSRKVSRNPHQIRTRNGGRANIDRLNIQIKQNLGFSTEVFYLYLKHLQSYFHNCSLETLKKILFQCFLISFILYLRYNYLHFWILLRHGQFFQSYHQDFSLVNYFLEQYLYIFHLLNLAGYCFVARQFSAL